MNEKALKVIEAAKSQLGTPYVFGMWGRECTPSVSPFATLKISSGP